MEFTVETDPETGWSHVVVSGRVHSLSEHQQMLSAVWDDPDYAAAEYAIWDFRTTDIAFDFADLRDLTTYIQQHKRGRGPRTAAIVAPHDLAFGLGRIFAALQDSFGFNLNVVRSTEEAATWLRGLDDTAAPRR